MSNCTTCNGTHFRLSGEACTGILRDLVLDGDWMRALRLGVDGLRGAEYGDVLEVLSGRQRLTGDEHGMDLEPDPDSEEYQQKVAWQNAGILADGPRWWRCYAYVDSWGEPDAMHATRRHHGQIPVDLPGNGRFREWCESRSLYYADNPDADRLAFLQTDAIKVYPQAGELGHDGLPLSRVAVLFMQVSAPPIWLPVIDGHDKWQAALDQFIRVNRKMPEARGAWHDDGGLSEVQARVQGAPPDWDELHDRGRKQEATLKHLVDKLPEGYEEPDDKLPDPPPPDEKLESDYGVITPDGKFYPCEREGHDFLCACLYPAASNGKAQAEAQGCIQVADTGLFSARLEPQLRADQKPSQEARRTAFLWCKKHREDFREIYYCRAEMDL